MDRLAGGAEWVDGCGWLKGGNSGWILMGVLVWVSGMRAWWASLDGSGWTDGWVDGWVWVGWVSTGEYRRTDGRLGGEGGRQGESVGINDLIGPYTSLYKHSSILVPYLATDENGINLLIILVVVFIVLLVIFVILLIICIVCRKKRAARRKKEDEESAILRRNEDG